MTTAETCPEVVYTNADRIRAMDDEELGDFVAGIAYARDTPWSKPFVDKFCKGCPTTALGLNPCDFEDGECPHGSDIVWWLQQPAAEKEGKAEMNLTKHCKGCKCASCRWQGTDNCLHDTDQPCSRCSGRHRCAWQYIERYYDCPGYERRASRKEDAK